MHYGNPPWYIAEGLIRLRKRIDDARIPASKLDESLNIATWNIREFGRRPRLEASVYFIAEILNQFDLIALTELRDNLDDLKRVMARLGPEWDIVYSDFTGDWGGNDERIAYLFDRRMVRFTGLAAEADPPRKKNDAGEYVAEQSWWRPPYMASFEAGNFDFVVVTAHIRWGDRIAERVAALQLLHDWVVRRRNEKFVVDRDFILMGDFNIPNRDHDAYRALTGDGQTLHLPDSLLGVAGTNLSQRNCYDQILHSPTAISTFSGTGGALDFYQENWESLYPDSSHSPNGKQAFTYELSDHLPLWLQLRTEINDERLATLALHREQGT